MKNLFCLATISGAILLLASCVKEPRVVNVESISLSDTSLELTVGDTYTLTATVFPSNADNQAVRWYSDQISIAVVQDGKVTAIKEGTTTITATTVDGGKTASCKVTVKKNHVPVASVSLKFPTKEILEGEELTLLATVLPETATNQNLIWSSSDPSVASVEAGTVKALKAGTTTITATSEDNGSISASCTVTVKGVLQYLTFNTESPTETNFLVIQDLNANIEFSYDKTTWEDCTNGQTLTFGNGQTLYLRGQGNNNANNLSAIANFSFARSTRVLCSGNIMSLLDYLDEGLSIKRPYCFFELFKSCTTLITAPELPATELASSCYACMFYECSSLTEAPVLPATKLAIACYSRMFYLCTSLKKAPVLPATQLEDSCYSGMFYLCSSLEEAPNLPATQLKPGCYANMFSLCTSLTETPDLPATELSSNCYYGMFLNCSSLRKASTLPATQLADFCYFEMFSNCTSLTEAPVLPATQLADYCYFGMFSNCSSLKKAPNLPAIKLAYYCYTSMFNNCTSLNHIKVMFTENDNYMNVANMLVSVYPTGTFVKNKAATWDNAGIVPEGWTVEYAEE